jgi:hypothetical protein
MSVIASLVADIQFLVLFHMKNSWISLVHSSVVICCRPSSRQVL